MNQEALLIDLYEVARLLNVTRMTVYNLIHREEDPLPYIKIGRATRVKVTDLTAWLDRQGGVK